VEEIFRRIPDGTGNLVKLLWFLETAGLAHREGRPKDETIEGQLTAAFNAPQSASVVPAGGAKKTAPQPTTEKPDDDAAKETPRGDSVPREKRRREVLTDDQLRAAHRKRMGRDFYAFIGLPLGSPPPAIDRKCKGLARRWRTPGKERQLPPDVQSKVDELLGGVQLVWRTLTDETHREEYDKRMQQGRAPKVGDFQTATSAPAPSPNTAPSEPANHLIPEHEKARSLMAKNDFKAALPLLKKIRIDDPSSPDIMADLGWSTWNLFRDKNGDAQEFLRLALTFEPNHPEGLEYLSKILVEQNEMETAQKLLMRLVRVAPDPTWAKKALQNLTKGGGK
jgi:tetratricopeptide (TPR) repeat protein